MLVFCSPKCLAPGDSLYDPSGQKVTHRVLSSEEVSKDLYAVMVSQIPQGGNLEARISRFTLLPTWDETGSLGVRHVSCSIE